MVNKLHQEAPLFMLLAEQHPILSTVFFQSLLGKYAY
jgi:hypothetical protein